MQALTREISNNNWILILLLLGLVLLFLMKALNPSRLKGYTFAFFFKGFIEKRVQEKLNIFSFFHILLFSFCILTLSLFLYANNVYYKVLNVSYLSLLSIVFIYFASRYIIDYLFSHFLSAFNTVKYFIYTKFGYLFTLSIWLFAVLILYYFSFKNIYFLNGVFALLFLIRFGLVFYNNKKLILNNLFYFILYICALEIAPLLVLYKLLIK